MKTAMRLVGYCALGAALAYAYAVYGVQRTPAHHQQPIIQEAFAHNTAPVRAGLVIARTSNTGWRAIWRADVSGRRPSWRQWDWLTGSKANPTNWALYTSRAANSFVKNDMIQIRALRDGAGRWTSAHIMSRAKFAPPHGGSLRVSADVLMPNAGHGYFPALWLLGANWPRVPWPRSGEFDIAESGRTGTVIGNLHCGNTTYGGPCHEARGLLRHFPTVHAWHRYALTWNTHPARIIWSVDDRPQLLITPLDIGRRTWVRTFDHPYHLIANVAIGGIWPGPPDHTTQSGGTLSIRNLSVSTNRRGGAA